MSRERHGKRALGRLLLLSRIAALAFILALLYEWLRQFVFAGLPVWGSTLATSFFCSFIAAAVAYLLVRRQEALASKAEFESAGRKRAEKALSDQLHFVERLADVIPSPIFHKDQDGIYRGCNRAFEEYTGLPRRHVIGKTVYDVAPKDLADTYYNMDRELLSHPGVQTYESSIQHATGNRRDVIFNKAAYRDPDGNVAGLIGVVTDITERKQMEAALRESEERYRIAIEHSNDGVAIVKGDLHVYVNRKFLDMFGYDDAGDLVGKSVFGTVHPDDRDMVIEINRGRQRGEPVAARYEFKGIRKDGGTLHVEVSATRIIYQAEPATLAYLRDITERRETEERLHQAQKMEAIGTLVGGIAHDFNNILAAMIGFTELALKEVENSSTLERRLGLVLKAGMRGRDLVRQILTFSRKTARRKKAFHLTPLVKETCKLLRATLPATMEIAVNTNTGSDEVRADPSQMQQVLMNLATNAAHAMRDTGGRLEILIDQVRIQPGDHRLRPDMGPGNYVVLRVSDTGCGMDEAVRNRIFEPFFTTKAVEEGTGLGLSIVYGIVTSHGGSITVSSEPGKGSAFTMLFPGADAPKRLRPERATPPPGGKERILFVDDEELLVEMTQGLLEGLGYKVVATVDCRDALQRFRAAPFQFDLVIAYQTMPHMTGADLARRLLEVRPDIPIVLCTGYSETVSVQEANAIGIKELVIKPLTEQEMAETIRRALEHGGRP